MSQCILGPCVLPFGTQYVQGEGSSRMSACLGVNAISTRGREMVHGIIQQRTLV